MASLSLGLVAVLILAMLVPAAHAQIDNPDASTSTSLYFHIFDTFNRFVINTQAMDAEFFDVGGVHYPTIVSQGLEFNTIYGVSTAGPVEYDFIENGKPRLHPERGIAADIKLDTSVGPVVFLYVDLKDAAGFDDLPTAMPATTFRVTMREGDDPGRDAQLDEGRVIMSGQATVHLIDDQAGGALAGQTGPDGNPVLSPDAGGLFEVAVPLEIEQSVIPKSEAFNIRIDWYQELEPLTSEDEFAQGNLRLAADPAHLPRLEFAITNPIYIEFIHPQVAAGTLLIHTGVNSPWGTYDIDAHNISLSIEGPSSPRSVQTVIAQNQHVHGLHDQAAEITYLWNFRDEGAPDGEYVINMAVSNHAGSSTATGTAGFTISGKEAFGQDTEGNIVEPSVQDESNDSPATGMTAALALMAAALLARRRGA